MFLARRIASLARLPRWFIVGVVCWAAPLPTAFAADILVTSDADSGPGTLRTAIETAVSGDRIVFDIPGVPTIQLLSDLPTVSGDIAFANVNPTDVTIDRNGNGPLVFSGRLVDPTSLNIVDGLEWHADLNSGIDRFDSVRCRSIVGEHREPRDHGSRTGGPTPGSIGTFDLTGDLDATGATLELDLQSSGGPPQNDLIDVDGVLTVTGATLQPNFVGDQFQIGDNFLVITSDQPDCRTVRQRNGCVRTAEPTIFGSGCRWLAGKSVRL